MYRTNKHTQPTKYKTNNVKHVLNKSLFAELYKFMTSSINNKAEMYNLIETHKHKYHNNIIYDYTLYLITYV